MPSSPILFFIHNVCSPIRMMARMYLFHKAITSLFPCLTSSHPPSPYSRKDKKCIQAQVSVLLTCPRLTNLVIQDTRYMDALQHLFNANLGYSLRSLEISCTRKTDITWLLFIMRYLLKLQDFRLITHTEDNGGKFPCDIGWMAGCRHE